jgi:hypothetical protein
MAPTKPIFKIAIPHISAQTVRRGLRGAGIRARSSYIGIPLTPRRRQGRMDWLRQHSPRIWKRRQ